MTDPLTERGLEILDQLEGEDREEALLFLPRDLPVNFGFSSAIAGLAARALLRPMVMHPYLLQLE